jgi:hypothetical protein
VFGFAVFMLVAFGVAPARAGSVDIVVQSTTTAPGMAGQFDIDLVNNSASAVNIASFHADVFLPDTTFVTFAGIDDATTAPYIFSITGSAPPGFTAQLLPMEAAGTDLSATSQVVNPGETWGLAHVTYLVDPSTPLGTVVNVFLEATSMNFDPPAGTFLLDPTGAPVPANLVDGTITVGAPVPEPTSLTLLAISAVALVVGRRFVRRDG